MTHEQIQAIGSHPEVIAAAAKCAAAEVAFRQASYTGRVLGLASMRMKLAMDNYDAIVNRIADEVTGVRNIMSKLAEPTWSPEP